MKENDGIKINDIVTISYTAKTENGDVVLSSESEGPLTFKVGNFCLIKGLNKAVLGMKTGESKKCTFSPVEAFGLIDELLIRKISLSSLPKDLKRGQLVSDKNNRAYFKVLKIDRVSKEALIDLNHVMAGQDLLFCMTVLREQRRSSTINVLDKAKSRSKKKINSFLKMRLSEVAS